MDNYNRRTAFVSSHARPESDSQSAFVVIRIYLFPLWSLCLKDKICSSMLMIHVGLHESSPHFIFQIAMDDIGLISRGLFAVVGVELGTEPIVNIRRRIMALEQETDTFGEMYSEDVDDRILSGSECEGFRFHSSDRDVMFTCRDTRVIFSISQSEQYSNAKTLLMAECENTKPGFALMRLLTTSPVPYVRHSCVRYEDGNYVSSEKWVRNIASSQSYWARHGPCVTAIAGCTEIDHAICIKSDFLPESAQRFVRRIQRQRWPSASLLHQMESDGCLFVAIGAKDSLTGLLEWRISFSIAERRLIHSMNHVQFLCYGLLKVLLKEAIDINLELKGLLCLYFLKTAVFWEIANGRVQWDIPNFFSAFMACFQRLLDWITNEYCPNFFIPENNMFAGKIHGKSRAKLLSYLVPMFNEGCRCLLRCPLLERELQELIRQPLLAFCCEIQAIPNESIKETEVIRETWNHQPSPLVGAANLLQQIGYLDQLMTENKSQVELSVLNIWKKYILQQLATHPSPAHQMTNKVKEKICRTHVRTIINSQVDSVSHFLHAALYQYRCGMYSKTLQMVSRAQDKLKLQYLLYPWDIDRTKYRLAGGNVKPLKQMMREIVALPTMLACSMSVPELLFEHYAARRYSRDGFEIPPLVLVQFLSFLCQYNTMNIHACTPLVHELHVVIRDDKDFHIHNVEKAISWQILGICQEMNSDLQAAYHSYANALLQKWSKIRKASLVRISILIAKSMKT